MSILYSLLGGIHGYAIARVRLSRTPYIALLVTSPYTVILPGIMIFSVVYGFNEAPELIVCVAAAIIASVKYCQFIYKKERELHG